jgi:hypothetical protein
MRKGRNHAAFQCSVTLMLIFSACLSSRLSYSQEISNVDFEVIGGTVKINYDISGCSGNKNYDIKLSLGSEGELTELSQGLSGDIKNVPCGSSGVIVWDVLSDRSELNGPIYFVVEAQPIIHQKIPQVHQKIPQVHQKIQQIRQEPEPKHVEKVEKVEEIQEDKTMHEGKWHSRRSWRTDRGYIGGSMGIFSPDQSFSYTPFNPQQNGFFMNATVAYLPSLLLGISTTVYFYGAPKVDRLRVSTWKSWGVMIGPLISFPIGNRIKWETRPQIGYSKIYPDLNHSDIDSLSSDDRSGVAYGLTTGFRLNFGKRTCYMLNVEYLSATSSFEDYKIEPDLGLLGASFGIAYRFYKK